MTLHQQLRKCNFKKMKNVSWHLEPIQSSYMNIFGNQLNMLAFHILLHFGFKMNVQTLHKSKTCTYAIYYSLLSKWAFSLLCPVSKDDAVPVKIQNISEKPLFKFTDLWVNVKTEVCHSRLVWIYCLADYVIWHSKPDYSYQLQVPDLRWLDKTQRACHSDVYYTFCVL